MERQVETINKLVSSYMQIIARMTRDYIPKAIMYNIVQNVRLSIFDHSVENFKTILGTKICIQRVISPSVCSAGSSKPESKDFNLM